MAPVKFLDAKALFGNLIRIEKSQFASSGVVDASDMPMISSMRLALAFSSLLTIAINPFNLGGNNFSIWAIFFAYVAHSSILFISSQLKKPFTQSKLIHWLDVCWIVLIVFFTGGVESYFFFLFFFAILTAAFRWGFEEGARVSIASAVLFTTSAWVSDSEFSLAQLLLRTTFLLTMGYMSSYWGESKVALIRRLALLRDVSKLSNPRFGIDHTITNILERIQGFFNSSSCIVVMRDKEASTYSLRTIKKGNVKQSFSAELINAEAASPFMAMSRDHTVAYSGPRWPAISFLGWSLAYENARDKWIKYDSQASKNLAEFLEARSFISVPLSFRKEEGRIYVTSRVGGFSKGDALFLNQIIAQSFPVIENIDLLDQIASNAASQERKKIALDIHDTAIQPYIGLKLGLSAVRNKASAGNPLIEDLDKLMEMTSQVVSDLRLYAGTFKSGSKQNGSMLVGVLRQQVAQVKEFYGIEIAVIVEGDRPEDDLQVNDRLAAEILQVVREGLNNICKHTVAQRGVVKLRRFKGWIKIQIENEGDGISTINFRPKSIIQRAAALGGKTHVKHGSSGGTIVHIEIPI